jgi:PAS domain S-box-containing protein
MNRSRLISRFSRNLLLTAFLLVLIAGLFAAYVRAEKQIDRANHKRHRSFLLADELRQSSDDLSRMARTYVVTGVSKYKRCYLDILEIRDGKKPRPNNYERIYWDLLVNEDQPSPSAGLPALPLLERMRQSGFSGQELGQLAAAKTNSDRLAEMELAAMRLAETPGAAGPAARAEAQLRLHDGTYHAAKAGIMKPIDDFLDLVDKRTQAAVETAERQALLLRYVLMASALWLLGMLWRTYAALLATLGGGPDEVLAHISRMGQGDFSGAMPVVNDRVPSVMRSLAQTQTKLASLDRERRQSELALRQTNAHLENLINYANAPIIVWDPHLRITRFNHAFELLAGRREAEVLGHSLELLFPPARRADSLAVIRQTLTGARLETVELPILHGDGATRTVVWNSATLFGPDGQTPIATIAQGQDITARQQAEAERNRMEVQLRQAQKLESIGQLAAGIAHEINTPTQYIGDNIRFLQDTFQDITQVLAHYDRLLQAVRQQQLTPELVAVTTAAAEAADLAYLAQEVPKSIEQTLQGVARVAKIVRAMKDFSHPGSEAKVPTDLNQAIESIVTVAHSEWKYVADLDLVLDPQLPRVPCLPGEINQVILNLIINAAHAIGEVVGDGAGGKGRIGVSTSRQGDWAEIRVQDTGAGIPESARARIFDPFFTTKAVGKGTGQGLTIAYSVVVQQHGGTIEFETELGQGTTFLVRLPLPTDPPPQKNL